MASGGQIQPPSTPQATGQATSVDDGRQTDFKVGTQAFKTTEAGRGSTSSFGLGASPNVYDQLSPVAVNVVNDYPWTLSNVKTRKDIPYIKLSEHRMNQSLLKRQASFYGNGIINAGINVGAIESGAVLQILDSLTSGIQSVINSTLGTNVGLLGSNADRLNDFVSSISNSDTLKQLGTKGILDPYEEIWPDNPTNFEYYFPYFSKTQYELTTPQWQQTDAIGQAIQSGTTQLAGAAAAAGTRGSKALGALGGVLAVGEGAIELVLKGIYPVAGIVDRPRVFTNHNERTVSIQFPLYNTKGEYDWIYNRRFITTFASQNLFQKRDFITGFPPVFYRVYVPGQYFSFASCVTNFTVENLGNVRLEYEDIIVPDAYQVTITLTEMLMPSLNQYQAVLTGLARERVEIGRK